MTTAEAVIVGLPELAAQWGRIRTRLQGEVGDTIYRTWLRQMSLAGMDGDEVTVTLPTRFLRDWVTSRFGDRISALWQTENASVRRVDIRVGEASADGGGLAMSVAVLGEPLVGEPQISRPPQIGATVAPPLAELTSLAATPAAVATEDRMEPRSDITAALDSRFTFEGFVVGKPNEFAYACSRRVAERPSSPGFNPLFLYGGVGLGKTHLMHAIAWELTDRSDKPVSVAYMSAENFMYRFIAAIRC